MRPFLALLLLVSGLHAAAKPNILFILCDDLGYGDVHCLNPGGRIPTQHMDRLASAGMVFTDAHSASAVCSPTRYNILTGRYNWRSKLKNGVLGGFSPPLIEHGRLTVAAMLKASGYSTACIGKWHLGMNFPLAGGGFATGNPDGMKVNYAADIESGPLAAGFDSFFGISASLDMPPYVFIDNRRTVEVPSKQKEVWPGRKGPVGDSFEPVDVLPSLTAKAVSFLDRAAAGTRPFFLYLPLSSPHTPIVPGAEWKGKSGMNEYADFVMQTDATVGSVLEALDRNGLAASTLVILTSDNGCAPAAGFKALLGMGHNPSSVYRGHKADIFEGGHRIPFIARWPGHIAPGSRSDQTICLGDFMATAADLIGFKLPDTAAEDSVSILPALIGKAEKPLREAVVHHSANGSFAIRQGNWKLVLCGDSGGWSSPRPGTKAAKGLPDTQLYDLSNDIAERTNLAAEHPEVVTRLTTLLEKYVNEGRSTPGLPQPNTKPVRIRPRRGA